MQQQLEIKFFFPFTEQIPLNLDFTVSDRYIEEQEEEKRKKNLYTLSDNHCIPEWSKSEWYPTLTPQLASLVINGADTIGYMNVGNFKIGLESHLKWYHKLLYKLLGFSWSRK